MFSCFTVILTDTM